MPLGSMGISFLWFVLSMELLSASKNIFLYLVVHVDQDQVSAFARGNVCVYTSIH